MAANGGMIAVAMEKLAPVELAESWDNVGFLMGDLNRDVKKGLLTLDVTMAVVEEAIEMGAEIIISHHPFPFHPLKTLRTNTLEGKLVASLVKQDITIYAAHTNLDAAINGVNDVLAQTVRLHDVQPLRPIYQPLVKIATYVPKEYVDVVWAAMSGAGAGHIGKYSQCGFRVAGTGTFLPGENAKPFIGERSCLSRVEEVRIETVAPEFLSKNVVQSMIEAHPYEEAAYDIYPLKNELLSGVGLGRVGELKKSMTLADFSRQVKTALGLQGVRFVGSADTEIKRVAVCGGAGMDLADAALASGADVFLTGDIRYHDARDANEKGLCLVDAGHFGTEIPVLKQVQDYLNECSNSNGWNCSFHIAEQQADIWQWG